MARGPSRYELDNGGDISRMTVAQIERRLTWLWIIAGVLGVLALLGTMLS